MITAADIVTLLLVLVPVLLGAIALSMAAQIGDQQAEGWDEWDVLDEALAYGELVSEPKSAPGRPFDWRSSPSLADQLEDAPDAA